MRWEAGGKANKEKQPLHSHSHLHGDVLTPACLIDYFLMVVILYCNQLLHKVTSPKDWWGLTWGDVDAGYGHCGLFQCVQDGAKGLSHSSLEAEAKDGVYHQVVRFINHFGLRRQFYPDKLVSKELINSLKAHLFQWVNPSTRAPLSYQLNYSLSSLL